MGVSRTTLLAAVSFGIGVLSLVIGLIVVAMADVFTTNSANRGASYAVSTVLAGGAAGGDSGVAMTVEANVTALAVLPHFVPRFSWKIGKYIRTASGTDCNSLTQNEVNAMFAPASSLRGPGWDVSDGFRSGVLTDTRGSRLACYGVAIPHDVSRDPDRVLIVGESPTDNVFEPNCTALTYTEGAVTYDVFCNALRLSSRLLNGQSVVLAYHY